MSQENWFFRDSEILPPTMMGTIFESRHFDIQAQINFLNAYHLRFNHLDWLPETERLWSDFCYALLENNEIIAMLSCANDIPLVSWVRFFVCSRQVNHANAFETLMTHALGELKKAGIRWIYALGSPEWFQRLIQAARFKKKDEIVTLKVPADQIRVVFPSDCAFQSSFRFRAVSKKDLDDLARMDQKAFNPAWQLGKKILESCLQHSSYTLLALHNNFPVAYLLCETLFGNQHISRIAVDPEFQGLQIATKMLSMMIEAQKLTAMDNYSVNTDAGNHASLALYERFGFRIVGEPIDVYGLNLEMTDFQV